MARRFRDRDEAGEALAEAIAHLELVNPVVLALPRGGVPVAVPVARRLGAPLDVIFVRKIGSPGNAELAAGAVVDGDPPVTVFNDDILRVYGLSERDFGDERAAQLAVIADRRARYLGGRAPQTVSGRSAVVVDDGIATGATMRAALRALQVREPAVVVLAVPVAPSDTLAELRPLVDRVVCLSEPAPFYGVGAHYDRFDQVPDAEVIRLLSEAATE